LQKRTKKKLLLLVTGKDPHLKFSFRGIVDWILYKKIDRASPVRHPGEGRDPRLSLLTPRLRHA
jgi:hypothetical protein